VPRLDDVEPLEPCGVRLVGETVLEQRPEGRHLLIVLPVLVIFTGWNEADETTLMLSVSVVKASQRQPTANVTHARSANDPDQLRRGASVVADGYHVVERTPPLLDDSVEDIDETVCCSALIEL